MPIAVELIKECYDFKRFRLYLAMILDSCLEFEFGKTKKCIVLCSLSKESIKD